ncbi:hypothetical protein [Haloechinothrix sp. LS1_15]|uniref:hypothetical protein n=1 Tax=Haloechinothrix sp. LS1_15 TaxID=2652248 RepID=UPI002944E537|nr:hypothetical protein [Haloechinothrix sp. LS1_15]MDV6011803.1 hypothetical protein [Haloechinothrix sp. LS1_15]
MPRRNRPGRARKRQRPEPPALTGWGRTESGPDGDWIVRSVPGERAIKQYRCPGCDHEIREGTPHVVAWPADSTGSVTERRHWHRGCWHARQRRGPPQGL